MSHLILPGILQQARNFPFRGHSTLAPKCIGWFNFDGNADDELDTYDGTEYNTPSYGTGLIGQEIQFAASSSERVQVTPDATLLGLTQGAISAFITPVDLTTCNLIGLGGSTNTTYFGLHVIQISGGKFRFTFREHDDNGSLYILDNTGGTTVSSGTRYHVVITSDGSTTKLYINGNDEGVLQTGTNTGGWFGDMGSIGTALITFGCLYRTGGYYGYANAKIDLLGYFDENLTTSEISALYNSGNGLSY